MKDISSDEEAFLSFSVVNRLSMSLLDLILTCEYGQISDTDCGIDSFVGWDFRQYSGKVNITSPPMGLVYE